MWKLATRWCLNIWIFEYWIFPAWLCPLALFQRQVCTAPADCKFTMIFDIFRLWKVTFRRKVTDQSQVSQDGDSPDDLADTPDITRHFSDTKLGNQIICLMSIDVWRLMFRLCFRIFRRFDVNLFPHSFPCRSVAWRSRWVLISTRWREQVPLVPHPRCPSRYGYRRAPIPRYPLIPSCNTSCNWCRKQSASRVQAECSREVKWSEWSEWSEQEEGGLGSNLVVQESRSLTESNWVLQY